MNFETINKTKLRIRIIICRKYLSLTSVESDGTAGHKTEKQGFIDESKEKKKVLRPD